MTDKELPVYKNKHFRINRADDVILDKILSDENVSFQMFMDSVIQAFMRGDPNIMKVLKDFKKLRELPKEVLEEYAISHRERTLLLDEFEKKGGI